MRKYLRKQALQRGATSCETDKYGNLLIVKGESDTYPCLAAHIDQVQDLHSKDFTVLECGGDVLAWSSKTHSQQGLGADDKNGIFICLELLEQFDVLKVAFFVGEEVGCKGSSKVDLEFFKDCRFIIEPDRRGGNDLITSMFCGAVCSHDFIEAIGYEGYGYLPEQGSITDVGTLVERGVGISCLNLSCGYYGAHSDHEITVLSELENCLDFVSHIVETCTDVYPFENRGFGYDDYEDYYGSRHGRDYFCSPFYDEQDYYAEGWDAEDIGIMEYLVAENPDMPFDQIIQQSMWEFHANVYFDREQAESILADVYADVKFEQESKEEAS